jgi:hypothetical protein
MLTKAAGRAMARQLDGNLFSLASQFQGGTATTVDPDVFGADWWAVAADNKFISGNGGAAVIGSDGNTLYDGANAAAITDAAILSMILLLENADVDSDDLVFVVPPSAKRDVLSIDKHVLVDQKGRTDEIRGSFGEMYGIPVVISNACPKINGGADRVGTLMSKEALYLAMQWDVRSQVSYKQELLH